METVNKPIIRLIYPLLPEMSSAVACWHSREWLKKKRIWTSSLLRGAGDTGQLHWKWGEKSRQARLGIKREQCPPLAFRRICGAVWLLYTAEASAVRAPPAIHLHLRASISPTQCGFKRTGALKSAPGSSFRHDVSARESERERGGLCSGTEFIQYYWDIYSLADRYGEPPIPAPVSDAALRHTLIQLHWGGDALSASLH